MAQVTSKIAGRGSIIALEQPERKCRRWQLRVSTGYNHLEKKYVTKTRRVTGTKTEAQKELRSFIRELESGIRTNTTELTFSEFAEGWRQERILSGEIEKGTQRNDERHIRALNKHIGNIRLLDLNAETIASLYIVLRNGGSLSGKPLSGTSARKIAITLKSILSIAVQRNVLAKDPSLGIKMPSVDTPEKEALTAGEARELVKLLTEGTPDAQRTGALLALICGLRRGEVLGLAWGDLDTEKGHITISRSLSSDSKGTKAPKTRSGKRKIPLDLRTYEHLKKWREVQAEELSKLGLQQDAKRPIITSKVGGVVLPDNFSRFFRRFLKRNKLKAISLHQLRHTFATTLVANRIDIVTGKTLMGHSDTKLLTELYAHAVEENVSDAMQTIGGVLYGDDDKEVVKTSTAEAA
ncbi:MAG: tyrosine-type recombinase/integrase [Coriobacteriia bacterium]|nr:tyrosine-type recombinase/integrase [Coriobacteriia bacterium]